MISDEKNRLQGLDGLGVIDGGDDIENVKR